MPKPKVHVPSYCLHKPSGQAVCFVNRQTRYLGPHGSPESKLAYSKLLAELQADPAPETSPAIGQGRTIGELLLKYKLDHQPKYSAAEQDCQNGVIRIVRELFAELPANDFGPLKLRTCRDAMRDKGWSPGFINRQIKRLRYIFRMGVSWEYVSQTVADALKSVPSLEESGPVNPRSAIPEETRQAVREKLKKQLHRDLFDLMLLTGARPGELIGLTNGDLEKNRDVWRAKLKRHKTAHRGKSRVLHFNPKAQLILRRYISDDPTAKLFKIRRDYFGRVVGKACEAAGVERFTPHWLRHTVITHLADEMGVEAAQRLGGHASKAMTEHYATAAEKLAVEAAKRLG